MAVVSVIRLPAVNDPRFDLKLLRGKHLDAQSIEEPRSVGGHVRRLVGPIVKVVVAEQTNVGDENSRIDVHSAGAEEIEVVPTPGLRNIFVGASNVPLADSGAGVIARGGGGKQSIHGQNAAADVTPVEVAAHADLFQLKFAGSE